MEMQTVFLSGTDANYLTTDKCGVVTVSGKIILIFCPIQLLYKESS